jgi:sugar phosphate permease
MDHSPSASIGRPDIVQKVTRRLIPFVGICYLIAYIDRQNVSFAKLQMVGDLGLSEYAYGLGASLFFIGYFFFEVPSNVIMEKVGARRWFARIMISKGRAARVLLPGAAAGAALSGDRPRWQHFPINQSIGR